MTPAWAAAYGGGAAPAWAAAHGVTSREFDVLQLVAGGSTSAEGAARLQVSARTLEHHVARMLARAGRRNVGRWPAGTRKGQPPRPPPVTAD